MLQSQDQEWPRIRTAGFDGFLVSFSDQLSEPANRAALALRSAIEQKGWAGLLETSTSLVSTYLRFDPMWKDHAEMHALLDGVLSERDWMTAALPQGRRLWRIPTVFGTSLAPQLDESAALAGLSAEEAIASVSRAPVRVQTIGFAAGMPYLGELSSEWNIPRQTELTAQVPAGGLCVAIRQLVLFPVATPTGWRHIGQTAFSLFRPDEETPFVLRAGDEVLFEPVAAEKLEGLRASGPDGGAYFEDLT